MLIKAMPTKEIGKKILFTIIFSLTIMLGACGGGLGEEEPGNSANNSSSEGTSSEGTSSEGNSQEDTASEENNQEEDDSGENSPDENSEDDEVAEEEDENSQEDSEEENQSDDEETDNNDQEDNTDSEDESSEDEANDDSEDTNNEDETEDEEDTQEEEQEENDDTNDCSAAAWSSGSTYLGGDQVVHNGVLYQAKWWTQTEPPAQEWQQIDSGCSVSEDTNDEDDQGSDEEDDISDDAIIVENHSDKLISTFFVEWGVYDRNYHVSDVPAEKLTHLYYGFLPICGPNDSLKAANPHGHSVLVSECAGKPEFSVTIHDTYAALEKSYPGDKWNDPIKGSYNQLNKLKKKYPHLKMIISVGGWTLSDPFHYMANDPQSRAVFVNSMMDFLRQYDFFDGVDIDWEYPGGNGANPALGGPEDFQSYADLMCDIRSGLDGLEAETGREYELSTAIGASPAKIDAANYADAHSCIDHILAMTYDYYGAWNNTVGHLAALNDYPENSIPDFYATSGVDKLLELGVPPHKIAIGATMYGRGWSGVQMPADGNPLNGVATGPASGEWETGSYDYKTIVEDFLGGTNGTGINGFTYYYDETAEAPYVYNDVSGTFITYDNPRSVKAKANYVIQNNLGGIFSWEIDADNGDILGAMNEGLGSPLVTTSNQGN